MSTTPSTRHLLAGFAELTDHELSVCRDELRRLCDDPDMLRNVEAELAHRGDYDLRTKLT